MDIRQAVNKVPADLNVELSELMKRLDDACASLELHSREWAVNEDRYRGAKATATIKFKNDPQYAKATVQYLDALVDNECGQYRESAYMSRSMKEATYELVRSLRAQLSALQTQAGLMRTEMDMEKGPQPQWSKSSERF